MGRTLLGGRGGGPEGDAGVASGRTQGLHMNDHSIPAALDLWFLLQGDDEDGPYPPDDVAHRLATGELTDDCFACCEGMREWRSVKEALIWAVCPRLSGLRDSFGVAVEWLLAGDLDRTNARQGILETARAQDLPLKEYEREIVDTLLEANLRLRQSIQAYRDRTTEGMDLYPCWELAPVTEPRYPRDWQTAWLAAGGQLSSDRMVARKDGLVWTRLSDFGFPFPPFSFDPGIDVLEVSWEDAVAWGIIDERAEVRSPRLDFQPPILGFHNGR